MTMFRTAVIALIFVFLCFSITDSQRSANPSQVESAVEAILGVGVRLQVLLNEPDNRNKNFVASPFSITVTLAQLLLGADGKFARQLYNLLSLPDSEDSGVQTIGYTLNQQKVNFHVRYSRLHLQLRNLLSNLHKQGLNGSYELQVTNSLFHNTNIKLRDDFVHNLRIYLTTVSALDFDGDPLGSQKSINDWAAASTKNLITSILDTPPLPGTAALLSSALYFKADWEYPFSNDLNHVDDFYLSPNKTVKVEFLRGIFEEIKYANSQKLGCNMIALPYKNDEIAMYILLPHQKANGSEYDIQAFVENIKAKDLFELIDQARLHAVTVQIPKIKLKKSISVLKPLQKYKAFMEADEAKGGTRQEEMNPFDTLDKRVDAFQTFNTTQDEVIILKQAAERDLIVSDIIQELSFEVNEKGTEASAVSTAILINKGASKTFKANRPFLFLVRHQALSISLFWGAIVDPSQAS